MRRSGGSRSGRDESAAPYFITVGTLANILPDESPGDLAPEQQATIAISPPEIPPESTSRRPQLLHERSRSMRTSVYRQGARVSYDPDLQAMCLEFVLWPLHSAEDLDIAFDTLRPRISAIIARRHLGHVRLLLDLTGFEVAAALSEEAEHELNVLIATFCSEAAPAHPFVIRYDSRLVPASRQRVAARKRFENADPMTLPGETLASREEAVMLLHRLRMLP